MQIYVLRNVHPHEEGGGTAMEVPTGALPSLFIGNGKKQDDKFQPRNLTFDHSKRTTFDGNANVRARVRFRTEGGMPVAWLDDLHSLHPHHFRGRGDQQGAWQLPGGAPYATDTSMHEYVGGVKVWRIEGDKYRIKFYGPRSMLPGFLGEEPKVFAVYAEVPVANATKWNPKAWKLLGAKRHLVTFKDHVAKLFPMIMATLIHAPQKLVAQMTEDKRVREEWAKGHDHPIVVHKTGMDMSDEDVGITWWKPHPDDLRENLGINDKVWWYPDGDAHDETARQRIKATITKVNNLYSYGLPRTFDLRLHDPDKTIVEDVPMVDVEFATWGGVGTI